MEYREFNQETAKLFYKLSGEEMNCMNALHKNVIRIMDAHRREKGERLRICWPSMSTCIK